MAGQPTSVVANKGIRGGLNGTGAIIGKFRLVALATTGGVDHQITLSAAGGRALGATMQEIAIGERGDVQTEEKAIVEAEAGVTQGAALAATNTGTVTVAGTGNIIVGVAVSVPDSDGLVMVELAGPAGGAISP